MIGSLSDLNIVIRNGFLLAWTSQKFCSHGMQHGSYDDDGDGIIQRLSKQFLIVIKLQGCVAHSVTLCSSVSFYFIFRIFIFLCESRHKFKFGE